MNHLLSAVRRGQWLLDISNIESYDPFLAKLLLGESVKFTTEPKMASLMEILDNSGKVLKSSGDGVLTVPKNSIAQVSMVGEILPQGDWCTYGADEICEALMNAQANENVDATVFRINGPGGAVACIDYFREFAPQKTKPIVGLIKDALSLHYWAAVTVCDYLIIDGDVSPRVGSVGIVCSYMDRQKQLEALGVKIVEIYPDESEHKNDAFRLAKEGKYDLIRTEHLKPLAVKFQEGVRAGRPGLIEEPGMLTGKTYYPDAAVANGMADEIGNINTAIAKARALAMKQQLSSLK